MREKEKELTEKIINIRRVSKKIKGGNKIGFSVLSAVGDKKGRVGVGLGKAPGVREAIQKSTARARKNLIKVSLSGTTIPHPVKVKRGAAKVLLQPAPPGAGLIAGGPVRIIAELVGIKDMSAKILGARNKLSNTTATLAALKKLKPVSSQP